MKRWYAYQGSLHGQMPLIAAFSSKKSRERWVAVLPDDRRAITYIERQRLFSPKYREENGPIRFRLF